jgi:hypothetical protein
MIKPGIAMAAITILAASFPAISVARHEQAPDAQRSLNLVGGSWTAAAPSTARTKRR